MKSHWKHYFSSIDPLLIVIFLVAAVVRSFAFGSIPGGFNQDEASTAYDAYSLIHYGIDRIGFPMPVVLVSWGSGMYAFAAYLAAPFIGLLGLSVFSARLPHLLVGLFDIIVFAALLTRIYDKQTARIGALLLGIAPWHIMISRWGLDSNVLPSIVLLGVFFATLSIKRPWCLLASFACFGLALYAYGTAYVFIPVFLLLITLYAWMHRFWKLKPFLGSCGVFAVLAIPIALFVAINSFHWPSIVTPVLSIPRLMGTPRFETMGNIHITDPQFFLNLWSNLSNAWQLFLTQNDGLIWNAIPGYGILYLFSTPFVVLGFLLLCRECFRKKSTPAAFLLAWCVGAVVLCAFVSVNINRANIAMLPLLFCATLGVAFFRKHSFVFVPVIALYLVSFVGFTWTYFTVYPPQIAQAFNEGLVESLAIAGRDPNATVCVTDNINMPYIFALFANEENPHVFGQTVQYNNPGAEFQSVSSFGRYSFGFENCENKNIDAYVVRPDEIARFVNQNYIIEQHGGYIVLQNP